MDTIVGVDSSNGGQSAFGYDSLQSVRKKLLDLTGRNQLINYKHPKASCVRIIDELPDQIYEELQNEKAFTFIPVPEPTEDELIAEGYLGEDDEGNLIELKPYPNAEQWAKYHGLNTSYDLPDVDSVDDSDVKHQDLNIQTLMYANELESRLRSIRGKAETAVEESGSNVLYLVLGFLEWYESRESDTRRMAPLFTLPVKLERTKLDQEQGVFRYVIKLKDEGLLTNITLAEKLANDFDLALPDINDDSTPEDYFQRVQRTVLKHKPRWKLHRMATLAILNFTKQVMYEDLDPTNWPEHNRIEDHPIIRQFFAAQDQEESTGSGFIEEYDIDQIDQVHDQFPLIFEADSSQHSALIDAAKGESLVIEGPPGSGKSQTITNLIAACIANGKRVLFVAEKMAALEVVKSRLDKAGLGDFCLELHSHKTQKQRLLEDLSNRLNNQGKYHNPQDIDAEIARFEDLKQKLNRYVQVINDEWKSTGLTIHDILNRATRYREALSQNPDQFLIENVDGSSLTPVRRKELIDYGEMLKSIYRQVQEQAPGGEITNHYWYGVNNTELLGHEHQDLIARLDQWTGQLTQLHEALNPLLRGFGIDADQLASFDQIRQFVTVTADLPDLLGGEPLELLPQVVEQAQALVELLDQYESLYALLGELESNLTPPAIQGTKAPLAISHSIANLKTLGVLESETLATLQSDFEGARSADSSVRALTDQLQRIRDNLPDSVQDLGQGGVDALKELKTFISLISELPADLWRHRDGVYDQPEMDELLSSFTSQFNYLVPIHKELKEHFKLDSLPQAASLKELEEVLCHAGFFRFLSKRWWVARKVFFNLAASAKPKKKPLVALLPKLLDYKQRLEGVDQLNAEYEVLGGLYQGMDTPVDRIVALRKWYRAVREEYGRGLGPKAKYAEALFTLDRDLAIALADLNKNGFTDSLEKILGTVAKLRQRYTAYQPLADGGNSLVGEASPLARLQADMQKPLNNLVQCFKSVSIHLAACADVARNLQRYQEAVPLWQQNPLAQLLAPTPLPLEIALGKKNEKALVVARNFTLIAQACGSSQALFMAIGSDCGGEQYNKLRQEARGLGAILERVVSAWGQFETLGKVNEGEWTQSSGGKLAALIERNQKALANPTWLNNWLDYIRLRRKLTNQGMQQILNSVESGDLGTELLIDIVNMVLMHQLSKEILTENSFLAEFSGMEQMAIRERFCEYDKKLLELQRQKIAHRASRTSPPAGNAAGKVGSYTDVALIKHEAGKKTRHIAVRALIDRAGKAIQALKPCFMMSPMSVAQYIKPGDFEFDIVVMDEASQIRPEDALGAIARGRSLVVVGDPKQLPPTSFFDKMTNEEFDEDTVALEESESILESAMPMFRTRRLRWHYRSRHESLIAFSNLHYYNSDLVIFPSPYESGAEFGIRYHKVQRGRFARGKNAEEARAIAKAALLHMVEKPEESIGLVAMNAEQRNEIEMHIEQLLKENPGFQTAFEKNRVQEEPLFIKNLENVQGDERDVIMISMTYGPDEVGGKVYQRFGPINKDVGWRRLNVLFTRSKKRMHIFSSMSSQDIQITSRSKKGVQSLRHFLEYCENGHLVTAQVTERAAESDFEIAVMNALSEKGYECVPQLGVAGYYLDLAIKDPDYPDTYLMGIECDGATYHSAKSARDRDRLRQEILESLGWRIRRIWSTDWFKNPEAQLQPILNELESLTQGRVISQREVAIAHEAGEQIDLISPSESVKELEQEIEETGQGQKSLMDILSEFDRNIIRDHFPSTSPKKRLLRQAMMEALVDAVPTSKEEFSLKIPHYLRSATDVQEAKEFLDPVLELIGEYG